MADTECNNGDYFCPCQVQSFLEKEKELLKIDDKKNTTVGLALSGGGIRSATFNLGVLQALAKAKILQRIDYLSTVSGGGYIGASLTWLLSDQGQRILNHKKYNEILDDPKFMEILDDPDFREILDDPIYVDIIQDLNYKKIIESPEYQKILGPRNEGFSADPNRPDVFESAEIKKILDALRKKKIMPDPEFDEFVKDSRFTKIISNRKYQRFLTDSRYQKIIRNPSYQKFCRELQHTGKDRLERFGVEDKNLPYGVDKPGQLIDGQDKPIQQDLLSYLRQRGRYLTPGDGINALTLTAVILRNAAISLVFWLWMLAFLLYMLIWCGGDFIDINLGYPSHIPKLYYAFGLIGALIIVIFVLASLAIAIFSGFIEDNCSTQTRRKLDVWSTRFLSLAIVLLVLFAVSWVAARSDSVAYMIAGAGVLFGWITSVSAFFKPDSRTLRQVVLPVASALLAFGLIVFAYALACKVWNGHPLIGFLGDWTTITRAQFVILVGLVFVAYWFADLNFITIARFYRDRLKEAYMPDSDALDSTKLENLSKEVFLQDMCKPLTGQSSYRGPYHIINTNAILIDSDNPKSKRFRRRGGDSFILSPLYCGSEATGWRKTERLGGGRLELTLATAMQISGAAVNPNAGVNGRGITRNRLVSFVMAILNLRLGGWVHNPKYIDKWWSLHPKNLIRSAWYGIGSVAGLFGGYEENRSYIQLSDGGHFENLGLYELLRRKLDIIIVSDAAADPQFTFSDLRNALRLTESDFGVEFETENKDELFELMPEKGRGIGSPIALAEKGFLKMTVRYKNADNGKYEKEGVLYTAVPLTFKIKPSDSW